MSGRGVPEGVASSRLGEQLAKTEIDLAQCLVEAGDHVESRTHAENERAKAIDYEKRVMASTSDADTIDSGEACARMRDTLRAWKR